MAETSNVRNGVPVLEPLRSAARLLRAWLLSLDLRFPGPFFLSKEEQAASAALSVVVPVHDAPEVTRRCLASLERFGGEAEVILVDDGSTLERTHRMLDEFCARNNWKLVRHQTAGAQPGIGSRHFHFIATLSLSAEFRHRCHAAELVWHFPGV